MTPIAEVADRMRANPAPVLIVDSCNFLDLIRVARPTKDAPERRVDIEELKAAVALHKLLTSAEPLLHHLVPELVPREFADNAAEKVERPFRDWLVAHEKGRQWLADATAAVGVPLPPSPVVPPDASRQFRDLAARLLATATVLERDLPCLLRAVERLISKRRPSHKKEMKDSMNLEQALELCRRLADGVPFPHPICFVSANTKDFADSPEGSRLHPDLEAEFDAVNLLYFTSLRSARGHLLKLKYAV